jgi:large subunit ribosomal protein L25
MIVADYVIEAQPRTITGKKVSQLRRQGLVPVTVYGPHINPVNLQVPYRALEVALMKAGGTNLIDISAGGDTHTVLARSVQRHVIRKEILHVDFFAVDLKAKIRVSVPVSYVNESPVVEARLGILVYGATTLSVETLPGNLIHTIEIDLAKLTSTGSAIYVSDLRLGDDVTIINDPEEMVVSVTQTSAAASAAAAEEAEAELTSAEPEVIHKGKQEEEDF